MDHPFALGDGRHQLFLNVDDDKNALLSLQHGRDDGGLFTQYATTFLTVLKLS